MMFPVGLSVEIKSLFLSSQARFPQLPVTNAFASQSASNAMIVRHSSKDLDIFIERTWNESITSLSTLCKLINAFLFTTIRNSVRGWLHNWISPARASHQLNLALLVQPLIIINRK